ncbi:MAG: ABC transporter ATP-binding protein [Acidobacteriota bacterium]
MSKTYASRAGEHKALDRLDLRLSPGEIFGFLGPNGAGKSTTIRILLGLLQATSGNARIFGLDCWADSLAVRRRCGYLPGDARFYTQLTGRAQLQLLAKLRGEHCDYEALAERLGLPLGRRIKGYSKGMRQKLGIVQAVMHRPDLIILDEPTSALDPLVQDEVLVLLSELRDAGATIFFSSHVLSEVQKICDRVALIRDGQLLRLEAVEGMAELDIFRVRVRAPDIDPLRVALRKAGYEPGDDPSELSFTSRGDESKILALLAGHSLDKLRIEPLSLEEVFLELYRTAPRSAA